MSKDVNRLLIPESGLMVHVDKGPMNFADEFQCSIGPFTPCFPTRPTHRAARCCASMCSIADHGHAIDQHVHHSSGILMRSVKGGFIGNDRGIEDSHIREVARRKPAPGRNIAGFPQAAGLICARLPAA